MVRHPQAATHLSDYWNALDRGAPAEELDRLAALVTPSDLDTIHRARAMHQPHRPDPRFALRLEHMLMNAAAHPASHAIPLPRLPKGRSPVPSRPAAPLPAFSPRTLAHAGSVALRIALILLLVALTATGIWLASRDNHHQIATPPVATPTVQTSPDVPMYRGNPARTGVFPGPALVGSPVELWKLQLTEPINLGAAVVDGRLYFPAGNNGFEAHDAMTGDLIWSFSTAAPAVSAPAVVGGMAYVIDSDGTLYAVHAADGSKAWQMANLNVRSSVAPVDGAVYAVSPEGTFSRLDATTGTVLWQTEIGAEAAGGMAVDGGVAFQGNAAGVMTAMDTETGAVLWTFQNTEGRGNATVTVANGQIYITISGGDTNAMYAVDVKTGKQTWRQEQGPGAGFISATATPDRLYSVAEDGTLHALDAATGETVWTYQLQEFVRSIPVLVEGTLYVADNGGFVRAIDARTGVQEWEYPIAGTVDLGWPVVANGVLYIGTAFGNFYAITGSGMIAARDLSTPTTDEASVVATPPATPVAGVININNAGVLWQSGPDAELNTNTVAVGIGPDGITYALDGDHHNIAMFGPDGSYLGRWGKPGKGPGEFRFSSQSLTAGSIGFDANGNIYVFDSVNNRIQKFAPDHTFIKEWGSAGTAVGQFNIPLGTVDAVTGRVWVAEFGNNRVQVFDLDGNLLDAWGSSGSEPGQLMGPGAITVRPDGTLYVAEEATRRIQHFTAEGTFLGVLEQPETGTGIVYGMAVDAVGNLWTASVNPARVVVYRPDETVVTSFDTLGDGEGLGVPTSLAIGPDGNVAILATNGVGAEYSEHQRNAPNRVLMLDFTPDAANQSSAGTARMAWESSDDVALLSHASGVTLAPDGTVWVADGANSRFQIFDQGGKLLDVWGEKGAGDGQFNFVRSSNGDGMGMVSFGPDGSIYVADTGNTRIQRFDRDGNFLNAWGSFGSGNGQFISPSTIAIDSQGHVFVSDDIRNDIQKFSADGTWLATFGGRGSAPGQLNYQGFIAIAPDDTLWVADPENRRIQHFANDGAFIAAIPFTAIPGKPDAGATIAVDGQGRVYFADIDHSRLFVLDADGAVLGAWTLTRADGSPIPNSGGMVVGADGAIFIGDWVNGTLYRYDLDPPLDSSNATPVAAPGS